jgi:hypothetical protein
MGVCLQKEKIGSNVSPFNIYKNTIYSKTSLQEKQQLKKEK